MSNVEVRGYSERGMINALCYEIMYSNNSIKLLKDFLELCTFPFSTPNFENIQNGKICIEQSFSNFGDLDLLILLDGNPRQAVLLEAKVKTYQSNIWSISSEWNDFKQLCDDLSKNTNMNKHTSNLFVQLYRKMRLIEKVKNVDKGLSPDIFSSRWSLGENAIVRKASDELASYTSKVWFVALVPDSEQNIKLFISNEIRVPPNNLPDWDTSTFGYLTWEVLHNHCKRYNDDWKFMLANFEYNAGQIY
ncbi:MAG: hypothetical protein K6360_06035 [Deltaproteobacteria bacterium]